jgi:membrane protein YdbS with pleckstrin-like domain
VKEPTESLRSSSTHPESAGSGPADTARDGNAGARENAESRENAKARESAGPRETGPIPMEPTSAAEAAVDRFRRGVAAKQAGGGEIETEQSLWEGGYSAKAMGGVWLSAVVATIVLVVVALLYEQLPILFALAIAAGIWVIAGIAYAARRFGIHYELTTQRFIHQHGAISRRTERIEVIDIEDVSFHQGPVQRLLGIGTIDISSTDRSHPHLVMPGIAEVKTVAGLIDDVRRRERQRRSLHIRSM